MTIEHMKALATLIVHYVDSPSTPFHMGIIVNAQALVKGLEELEKELIKMQEDVSDICVEDLGMGCRGIDDARLDSLDDRFETILHGETYDLQSS